MSRYRRGGSALLRMAGPRALRSGARANDVGMMLRAMTLARNASQRGEVPVGAVVYHGRTVVTEHANDREVAIGAAQQ